MSLPLDGATKITFNLMRAEVTSGVMPNVKVQSLGQAHWPQKGNDKKFRWTTQNPFREGKK